MTDIPHTGKAMYLIHQVGKTLVITNLNTLHEELENNSEKNP